MEEITFSRKALSGLRLRVPDGDIEADLGDGPAVTVHLIPNEVACEKVVFVAEGYEMDNEGYWIHVDRLRDEGDWVPHLAQKVVHEGYRPGLVMLAEAIASKRKGF